MNRASTQVLDDRDPMAMAVPRLAQCKTQSPADRELREELHQYRYLMFQHGVTVREIAESEGVDERQIYLSIARCEVRLPKAEVMANRNFRNAMVAQRKIADKYSETLMDLMDGVGGRNWQQRSRALEHFRKTVGLETGAGVHVNVNQQAVVQNGSPGSFEEVFEVVRRQLATENPGVQIAASSEPDEPAS